MELVVGVRVVVELLLSINVGINILVDMMGLVVVGCVSSLIIAVDTLEVLPAKLSL